MLIQKTDNTTSVITTSTIVDNLTSTSTVDSLSANQGKVLKDTIDGLSDNFDRNYGIYKWTGAVALNATTTFITNSITITTKGRPVFLMVSGDNNPTTETAWLGAAFYKSDARLCYQISESHGASWNIPFSLSYLDVVPAGTYTYECRITRGAGDINLNESGDNQSPQFIVYEI